MNFSTIDKVQLDVSSYENETGFKSIRVPETELWVLFGYSKFEDRQILHAPLQLSPLSCTSFEIIDETSM